MQRFSRKQTLGRARWRPFAWATTALVAAGITAGFATAASAQPGPAAGVAPGATTVGNTNYVFYTAGDGSVWQKQAGSTSSATSVGGKLISAPSPITLATNTIEVFGEGTDHALWHTTCAPGGGCGSWTSLGGVLSSKPGAVFGGTGATTESVYVRGSDGTLWGIDKSTGWGAWHFVGGRLLSGTGPAAAFQGSSQFVLVVGTDRHLYLLQVGGPGFDPVGGTTTASPGLAGAGNGGLTGYATGTDSAGWWQNLVAMNGWNSLGGFLTSGFGATFNGPNASHWFAYALGGDGQVWQNAGMSSAGWSVVTP